MIKNKASRDKMHGFKPSSTFYVLCNFEATYLIPLSQSGRMERMENGKNMVLFLHIVIIIDIKHLMVLVRLQ